MSTLDPAAALTVELDALHAATHALSGAWAPRVESAQKSYLAAMLNSERLLAHVLAEGREENNELAFRIGFCF